MKIFGRRNKEQVENIDNFDDAEDWVEKPPHQVLIEFVCVSSSFDIEYYLSIMESTGNFINESIKLDEIKFFTEVIRDSPHFTLSSPSPEKAASIMFVLKILHFAKLIMKGMSNFTHTDSNSIDNFLKNVNFRKDRWRNIAEMTFVIVNVYKLIEENLLEPFIKMVSESEEYIAGMKSVDKLFDEADNDLAVVKNNIKLFK